MNEKKKTADRSASNIPGKFLKPYDPAATEDRIYKLWEESGFFDPDKLPTDKPGRGRNGQPFSIVLPPPNVTGQLHMGQALMLAVEDIMVRYARMKGRKTLWIPGTDHAAIATQSVVEKKIQKEEGKSRHDLGREGLLRLIEEHVKQTHDVIVKQIKKIGASIDWSREAFTLDAKRNLAVRTAFKKMYDDGLIYRGFRVVNWDPKGQTTISDDEIEYETRQTKLYTFKYSKDIPISISTTRPETKLGDTAIAVHPNDARYIRFIGKEFDAIFAGEPIHLKVIADPSVEPAFGTGALGVTPAHSIVDWEMGQKHGLPLKQVINEYARMIVGNEAIKDKKTTEAREAVVEWLKKEGLLEKEEDIEHNVSLAQRTGGVVEPLPKLQWFVAVNKKLKTQNSKVKTEGTMFKEPAKDVRGEALSQSVENLDTLKKLMKAAVEKGIGDSSPIKIIPDHFEKIYFNWIENLRDWCISRQIWYGHRIPVWYRDVTPAKAGVQGQTADIEGGQTLDSRFRGNDKREHGNGNKDRGNDKKDRGNDNKTEIFVGLEAPVGDGWKQDEDTLDTWFSSGLWTFSTLGWPDEKKFAKNRAYHPTTVLETGSDILFFWVARMILMSSYLLNEAPFKTVYLHGLVRDTKNRKISKSLGNNIDPLDMIAKYGADAVRMSLVVGVGPGNDSKLDEQKIKAYKLFTNKLWNITRFILENAEGETVESSKSKVQSSKFNVTDVKLWEGLQAFLREISKEMDEFKFYIVAEKLYHYVWHEFADKIIEDSKAIFENGGEADKNSRRQFLLNALGVLLKALHPFMPFVTEEIWADMPINDKSLLIIEPWPS